MRWPRARAKRWTPLTDLGSHEISGTRQALANPVVVEQPSIGQAIFDADDPTFSGTLSDVGGLIVFRQGPSDSQRELLSCLKLATPYSGPGVTIELPTEGLFASLLVQF